MRAGRVTTRSTGSESNPLWFKTAVFYEIHTRAFFDGNDDGSGDFRGLQQKLDYLQWLGIDCIWLPFYPSPLRDGGYDIADFYGINPDYGTVEDFRAFVEAAHERGIRVIVDLVMNHTSADHRGSRHRARSRGPTATGTSGRTRTSPTGTRAHHLHRHRGLELDVRPVRGQYYWHLLQPPAGPELREPGGAGRDAGGASLLARHRARRLPARRGPYLFEEGTICENLPRTHE